MNLTEGLIDSLKSIIGVKTPPTLIQSLSYQSLLEKRSKDFNQYLIAAETGSGKTFAFLLPLIDNLKTTENNKKGDIKRPRALIVAPTRELCKQLTSQLKSLTHLSKLKSTFVYNVEEQYPDSRYINDDVLIGSPDQLNKLSNDNASIFEGVEWLILDECDALFEKDFKSSTQNLVDNVNNNRHHQFNLILSTATVNEKFLKYVKEQYPKLIKIISNKTHQLPKSLKINYEPYLSGNKLADLKNKVKDILFNNSSSLTKSKNLKVLVFVNTNDKADKVSQYFNERGLSSISMTSKSKIRSKVSNRPIKSFLRRYENNNDDDDNVNVLVTTSLLARGLDFGTNVQNVIIGEDSGNVVDFIHRVGRTGRMNSQGQVTIMVPNKKYRNLNKRR